MPDLKAPADDNVEHLVEKIHNAAENAAANIKADAADAAEGLRRAHRALTSLPRLNGHDLVTASALAQVEEITLHRPTSFYRLTLEGNAGPVQVGFLNTSPGREVEPGRYRALFFLIRLPEGG